MEKIRKYVEDKIESYEEDYDNETYGGDTK
jgi:hypothetical protein